MTRHGRLLFPALRWSDGGFEANRPLIEESLAIGAGGFCIFGGDAHAVRALTEELSARSAFPLLFASDLERGAGQQFPQCTPLPPLAALGALDDLSITQRAASITAREALACGINWIYAPVADVDLEPANPIVGSRSFGPDPDLVARHVAAWVASARDHGVLCCAKHFPGHGRTQDDSHAALPHVHASALDMQQDLKPFEAAIAAGVDAVMTAHVVYHAFDGATAATLSSPLLRDLLRDRLGFGGLTVSDAIVMEGMLVAGGGGEAEAAVAALRAGCDALLYPSRPASLAAHIADAERDGVLAPADLDAALARIDAAASRSNAAIVRAAALRGTAAAPHACSHADDAAWADATAAQSCVVVRGAPSLSRADHAGCVTVVTIDDDLGGPHPAPSRAPLIAALEKRGLQVASLEHVPSSGAAIIAVYADIRAWKGRPGLSPSAHARLEEAVAARPDAVVAFFGHPRLCADLPGLHVLAVWGGEAIMQRAAAARLLDRAPS